MGYAYDELVPVALLWKNPGVTREEFCSLMKEAQWTSGELGREDPWDLRGTSVNEAYHFEGLYDFASLFGLPSRHVSEEYEGDRRDSLGATLYKPSFHLRKRRGSCKHGEISYEVDIHLKNELGKETFVRTYNWATHPMEKGSLIFCESLLDLDSDEVYIERVIKDWGVKRGIREWVFVYRPVLRTFYTLVFPDILSLASSFPRFHPDALYDFSLERGFLQGGNLYENFPWVQREGQYFLDEETMLRKIDGRGRATFQNLVLTEMALARNAGKMISYRGLQHTEQFFQDFPGTREKYERAVWDAFTFTHARDVGMTYNEALRFRLEGATSWVSTL